MAQLPPSSQDGPVQSSTGPRFPNPIPQLREPASFPGEISMRETPDMSGDIDSRLKIESPSDDDSDASLLSDTSSEMDDTFVKSHRGLPSSKLPTGLCYDERMRYHAEIGATSAENAHPEDPRRIYYIYKELCEAGLVDDKLYPPIVEMPLHRIAAREVTKDEILLIHEDAQFELVKSTAGKSTTLM